MVAEITAGPWRNEKSPEHNDWAEITGEGWHSLAKVAVRLDGEPSAEGAANFQFILSACNACFSINEKNPQVVAAEIPAMSRYITLMACQVLPGEDGFVEGDFEDAFRLAVEEARALLSRISAKKQDTNGERHG